jgi:hypothetical protein
VGGRELVLIESYHFANVNSPSKIQGPCQRHDWFGSDISKARKYFRHRNGEFARPRVTGYFDVVAFKYMCQGGKWQIVSSPHQAFPVLHGHLQQRFAREFIQPILGIAQKENQFYPGFFIEGRVVFGWFYLLHKSVFGGKQRRLQVTLPKPHIQSVVYIF